MERNLEAKLIAYNAIREQIYADLAFNEYDLTNDFTFSHALGRSTRRLRAAVERMQDMILVTTYIPTSPELAEAIRLAREGKLSS